MQMIQQRSLTGTGCVSIALEANGRIECKQVIANSVAALEDMDKAGVAGYADCIPKSPSKHVLFSLLAARFANRPFLETGPPAIEIR
jgi:hypothetical protein